MSEHLIPPEALDEERPNMGNPEFVESRVRDMLEEDRKLLYSSDPGVSPQAEAPALMERWAAEFRADNPAYIQTMTQEAQDAFLKQHGIGVNDTVPGEPVRALVAWTIGQFVDLCIKHNYERLTDDQLQLAIDALVEDTVALLLGIENPAD